MWSALGTIIVCAVYVSVGVLGILLRPAKENLLQQVDPYLAILEALISLAALTLVTLMCALHLYAPSGRRILTFDRSVIRNHFRSPDVERAPLRVSRLLVISIRRLMRG